MQSLNSVKYNQCVYDSRGASVNNCIYSRIQSLSFPYRWTKRLLPSDHYYNNNTSLYMPFCMWVQIWIFFQYMSLKVDLLGQGWAHLKFSFTAKSPFRTLYQFTFVLTASECLFPTSSHQRWIFANLTQEKKHLKNQVFPYFWSWTSFQMFVCLVFLFCELLMCGLCPLFIEDA